MIHMYTYLTQMYTRTHTHTHSLSLSHSLALSLSLTRPPTHTHRQLLLRRPFVVRLGPARGCVVCVCSPVANEGGSKSVEN